MMLKSMCDICAFNPSTIHVTDIINGEVKSINVCDNCNDQIMNMKQSKPRLEAGARCGGCGMDTRLFIIKKRMGCAACYDYFEVDDLFDKLHAGSHKHVGKVPDNIDKRHKIEGELKRLRYILEVAIESEDYEAAAEIRDRITKIDESGTI